LQLTPWRSAHEQQQDRPIGQISLEQDRKLKTDRLMKNIASGRVSIGFAATLLVLILNAIVAYQSISTIAEKILKWDSGNTS
jgi:hypothetical protein